MAAHVYTAHIAWRCEGDFPSGHYDRGHVWRFDGGVEVPASASPHVVPAPHSRAAAVDPEEAFVAALSSCHMLWFLDLARREGVRIARYDDQAEGIMKTNSAGKTWISDVILHPLVEFASTPTPPGPAEILALHHQAHERCFIANSVKTDVHISPDPPLSAAP